MNRLSVVSGRARQWRRAVAKRFLGGMVEELVSSRIADSVNILQNKSPDSDDTEGAGYKGDRIDRIAEMRKMMKGEARYGNVALASVVDFNRGFQMGSGLTAVPSDDMAEDDDAVKVVREFLDYNNLTEERALDFGTASEIEGQVCLRWKWDPKARHVRIYMVPLVETQYRVEYSSGDYTRPERLILNPQKNDDAETVQASDFVFIKFRAIPNGTYGIPTCAPCYNNLLSLDKAHEDLRKVNHLFARPTPVITAKNQARVSAIDTKMRQTNWALGTYLVLLATEEFNLVESAGTGSEALLNEMKREAQIISGVTGVPVHFLGYPELLSNRSTSESMFEGPVKRAQQTQRVWIGGFEELSQKVGRVYRAKLGMDVNFEGVTIAFPPIRAGNLVDLINAWLPVWVANGVTHERFLREIGLADAEEEVRKVIDRAKERAADRQAGGAPGDLSPEDQAAIDALAAKAVPDVPAGQR